jgi:outer membrane murein-binding lipoprotein Lpp
MAMEASSPTKAMAMLSERKMLMNGDELERRMRQYVVETFDERMKNAGRLWMEQIRGEIDAKLLAMPPSAGGGGFGDPRVPQMEEHIRKMQSDLAGQVEYIKSTTGGALQDTADKANMAMADLAKRLATYEAAIELSHDRITQQVNELNGHVARFEADRELMDKWSRASEHNVAGIEERLQNEIDELVANSRRLEPGSRDPCECKI